MSETGKLIVIEGLDGSGKATQAKLLFGRLTEQGNVTNKITFPNYEDDSSALVKMYLSGQFGSKPDDVNSYAASVFYTVDRYASYKKDWGKKYLSGEYFVADRYTTSNAVFQASKLSKDKWDEYLDWLFDFEYRLIGIPEPNLVIYLDVDPEVSTRLVESRYHGDESKKDIHEKDREYQNRCREAALYCADKLGWIRVSCVKDGMMRSIDEIHSEIMTIVEKSL